MVILVASSTAGGAQGAIPNGYHGMWGAGGCDKAKYYMRIQESGMQMYAADKHLSLGNWHISTVTNKGTTIIINTQETHSQQATYMELTKRSNGNITLLLKIGENGGTDELVGCETSG
ncbi:MAG: hypothetical protein NPIRA05_02400 [Nitrospirales bacterium]|nr:MAG: hypothetical protein NPIRA05_02400 [Nitrospirales bacterium]